MELHRLRTGTFIGKFIYGTPSFSNVFLPALLYAISFGQVPSAVRAPIEYLSTQNYLASRRLHFCLTGEWIDYPNKKLRDVVQDKIFKFCNKGPLELVYDDTVNLEPNRTFSQFQNYLRRTTDQNQLLSILMPPKPCCPYLDEEEECARASEFMLARDLVFIALRQLTAFFTILKSRITYISEHGSIRKNVRLKNIAIKKKSILSSVITQIFYNKRDNFTSSDTLSSETFLPLSHQNNPPYWHVLIVSPVDFKIWIRFDMPYLIQSVSTSLFITYLQLLTPSATKLPPCIALFPSSLISRHTDDRIICYMEILYKENYVVNFNEWSGIKNPDIVTRKRKDDGHELESYFSKKTSKPQENDTQLSRKSIFN